MSSIAIVDSTSQTHTVLVSLNDFELIDVGFQLELQLDVEERTQNRLTTLGDLSSWTEAPWDPSAPTQRW